MTMTAERVTGRRAQVRMVKACIAGAAVYCLFVATMLVVLLVQEKMAHPLVATTSGQMSQMRLELATRPKDEGLKQRLRETDARLRSGYLWRRAMLTRGAWLLLAGAVVLVGGIKVLRSLERPVPELESLRAPERSADEGRWAQWMIGGMGAAVTGLLLAGAWWAGGHPAVLPEVSAPVAAEVLPDGAAFARQWPVFRGWQGRAAMGDPEVRQWDGATGQGIVWKTEVPLPGHSSPIIWDGKVVVTGATAGERKIFAYDLASGKPLWETAIGGAGPVPEVGEDTGFAAPTAATEGLRAYAIFASGDVAAVDLASGRKVWEKNLGKPVSTYGYAASLTIWPDAAGGAARVIVQWDVGFPEDGKACLLALDGRTGRVVWRTMRPVGGSWASPVVMRAEGDTVAWQVVTAANPWVMGYDAASGAELWRAKVLGGDVAPTPTGVVTGGKTVVLVGEEAQCRAAIPISGARGELADAALLWKLDDEGLPELVSPTTDGRWVWTVNSSGAIYCFNLADGKKAWEHEYGEVFHASPVIVGQGEQRELWLTDMQGVTHRIAVAGEFKEVGTCRLGEAVGAGMAFAGGKVVVRGKTNLYCLGGTGASRGGGQ